MTEYDRDTSYRIDDTAFGFTVTVYYSRFQFIPESDVVKDAGRAAMLNIAHEVAESRGKMLRPIDEQRIQMSMGRNGFSGITSFSGSVTVVYADAPLDSVTR